MKKLRCIMMLLCATLFFASCKDDDETTIPVTNISINEDFLALNPGSSGMLTAVINPENATNSTITWSTDNETIAKVDGTGKVTAVGIGIANITATSGDREKTATCRVIVYPNRTVRFDDPDESKVWGEEMGEIEVPLIFENGKFDDLPITGKISVDNLVGCTNDDFTLETKEFTSMGNETQQIKIKVKDNDKFGEWSFRLVLSDVNMGTPVTQAFVVNIKDDERILGFKETTYEVEEGENININSFLYGGAAVANISIKIEVVADQTTALTDQYSLPATFSSIYKGTDQSSFNLRTYKHGSKADKILTLKITSNITKLGTGILSYNETQYCKITIKNTD